MEKLTIVIMSIIIKNGKLITPIRIIKNGGVVIRDSTIEKVFTDDNIRIGEKDRIIEVGGK